MKKCLMLLPLLVLVQAPANAQSFPFPIDAGAICRAILPADATPAEFNECVEQVIRDLDELLNGQG